LPLISKRWPSLRPGLLLIQVAGVSFEPLH
jgi:hypothetical protein